MVLRGRRGALFLPGDGPDSGPDSRSPSLYEVTPESETKQAVPKSEPKPDPPRWSNTEREAVRQSIARFRYTSGMRCNPEPFLGRLERIAAFYSASGHRVAMEFDHVYERVQRSPSTAPEKAVWFMAVLEARLKRKISKSMERERPIERSNERRAWVSDRYLAELKAAQERSIGNLDRRTKMEPEPDERMKAWMAQEAAALNAKLDKQKADAEAIEKQKVAERKQMLADGWSWDEIVAHQKEVDEFLTFQAKGGTMAEFLQLPGHGAGEPQAQSSAPEPTCGTGRELYDTQALIRGVAKSMEERQVSATMEEIYQQLNDKKAS